MTNQAAISWRRSSFSNGGGECVECAALPGNRIAIRDSKAPEAGTLCVSRTAMAALIATHSTQ